MKIAAVLLAVVVSIGGARIAREAASARRVSEGTESTPYAPSPAAAPFISLGYRELAADLLYIRLRVYWGGYHGTTSQGIASLSEAIVALDPSLKKVYEFGANAMTIADTGVDQSSFLRAIALLERGIHEFPSSWELPMLAGQIYLQDLQTDDPVLRRTWDERGVLHVEAAIRKPGAPTQSAVWASHIRTKLGQRERAIQGLRELLLVTNDRAGRAKLLERLATITENDSAEIAGELISERKRFETAWKRERPAVKATMYILIGRRPEPGFDLVDLATGGHDLLGAEIYEQLEPVGP